MSELLIRKVALNCSIDHAFEVFTGRIDLWWPRSHRRSADSTLELSPVVGGELIESAADGSQWVMGRVTDVERPTLLCLDWFPGSPAAPTSVDVAFVPDATGTEITITHRPLSTNAKSIWPQRVALFERGWSAVLPALADFVTDHPKRG